ncbi:MAG: hypothetical protein K2Q10_08220, partial [Rhodospirillales bacterium]|nr:hypothetical protein [Rhodospirillales bacterium]
MSIAVREMDPRDFIWLAALGTAARAQSSLDDICTALDDIVGHLWTPVAEVVIGCLDEMVRGDTLRMVGGKCSDSPVFMTTATGLQSLSYLLAKPVARPACPLGQVGMRLKLAFIDLMPASECRRTLEGAICAYEGELERCERQCVGCNASGTFGRRWLEH